VPVFHFSDADAGALASDYTAIVALGDGNSVTLTSTPSANGQIVANGGGFDVQLSYTYMAAASNLTFSVQVIDNGDGRTTADPTDTMTSASTSAFVVVPAPLLIAANNVSRPFGQPDPAFTITPTGFVLGDTLASLGGALTISSTDTAASRVSGEPYAITPSGLTSANYAILFQQGMLTITPAPLVLSLGQAQGVPVGTSAGTAGSFSDNGAASWTATINFGDGNQEVVAVTPGSPLPLQHVYAVAGVFTVQVSITDNLGDSVSGSFAVSVLGPTPTDVPAEGPTVAPPTLQSNEAVLSVPTTPTLTNALSPFQPTSLGSVAQVSSGQSDAVAGSGGGTSSSEHSSGSNSQESSTLSTPSHDLAQGRSQPRTQSATQENKGQPVPTKGPGMNASVKGGAEEPWDDLGQDRLFAALGVSEMYEERTVFGQLQINNAPESEQHMLVADEELGSEMEVTTSIAMWFVLSAVACETVISRS
jgi:hypothetical protein